ncbi:hypothetical protein [Mesorhizobium sp.]|uniref:hypothetical protein n=1 Tax=Mesorhizobium sp. TaxID=1871066 RepID=UPI000FE6C4F0|nr:hypothetical protein [Mesorhizobium sp.]RWO08245.1 MAG: hypothetical protein EOS15_29980 [Mesorhizobium sp.]
MKVREEVGIALAVTGLAILGVGLCCGLWFWFTEIVPFFWGRGNPWPAALPIAIAAFIGGLALQASTQDSNN